MRKNWMQCVKIFIKYAISTLISFLFCNFANMNTNLFYLLLLCFASGFTQCLLLGCCFYLIRRHGIRERTAPQFLRSFAMVLIMLSVGFLNNFVVSACRDLPMAEFINTLLILYDYLIVGGFMVFSITLVFPGRYKPLQLSLIELPYVVAMIVFSITRSTVVFSAVQLFTLVVSTALLIWLNLSIRRYNTMLRDNVGNLESFDLRWASILVTVLYVVQLFWAVESLSQKFWFTTPSAVYNLLFDTLWCLITMVYVLLIMSKIVRQQVFAIPAEEEEGSVKQTDDYYKMLGNSDIDALIRKNKYYLDSTLTLQKLATHLGTNRQYLSNYINREKGKTFYEYINDFRLEETKGLLDEGNGELQRTLEEIATMSGFNSYSTFLRSFVKRYGESPSKYMKKK